MTWITENPFLIVLTTLFLGVVLIILFFQTRKKLFLILAGLMGVIAVASVVVEQMIVTEKEQVEALVQKLADNVRDNDMEGILDSIVPEAKQTRTSVERLMPSCDFTTCAANRKPEFDVIDESSMTIYFPVFVRVNESPYGPGQSPVDIKLDLVKRNGKWMIEDYGFKLPTESDYHRL